MIQTKTYIRAIILYLWFIQDRHKNYIIKLFYISKEMFNLLKFFLTNLIQTEVYIKQLLMYSRLYFLLCFKNIDKLNLIF